MSEILKNKNEGIDGDFENKWAELIKMKYSGASEPSKELKGEYTTEEKKQIAKYERRVAEDQEIYDRQLKKLKKSEEAHDDRYEQAENFYNMDCWKMMLESDQEALDKLKNHEPIEKKQIPEEEEYMPEDALKTLEKIPDIGGFTTLKEHVKNAFYSVNVKYENAIKELSGARERRQEYLKRKRMSVNDAGEKDFWFFKQYEMNKARDNNQKKAEWFLETAKEYVGHKKVPDDLQYVLHQDDERWELEQYR